ncbi:hypercellular protein HypA [Zymoseptoria brevis]|uniref:Hypercellular protein HypA n=1 Tax=Zymoseptoria brevis TaxID=1047168 RepID=A0A0F4GW02_9PEZI|nr:hypercellular protein HypA [Zymoseptoria brevis]
MPGIGLTVNFGKVQQEKDRIEDTDGGAAVRTPDTSIEATCSDKDAASMDHYSPVAPACIRVLVLPVGQIERERFSSLVRRLQSEASVIPLADVEQRGNSEDFFLSPKASPRGSLLYRFSAAAPTEQQQHYSPFEIFREPLIVLGIVDGLNNGGEGSKKELEGAAAYLRERHPRVVHRQLVVLAQGDNENVDSVTGAIRILNADTPKDTSLRYAVCDLSARFLVEFTTYAKAVQASPTIQTPGQTAKGLQRTGSLRESERRPGSGHGTPPRISGESIASSPGPLGRQPPVPATAFDQIPSANATSAARPRAHSRGSDRSNQSRGSVRASSPDRVVVQGFGSGTSQEKTRVRGRSRVGIVVGSIYMMSGHWNEALRLFSEHTLISQKVSDCLWHGKGLENMLVCMMLLAWSSVEFYIPSFCDSAGKRTSTSRFSRTTTTVTARESAENGTAGSGRNRLSFAIPEMVKQILGLYRSSEGALELPFLILAEASIRFSKLLAALNHSNGELLFDQLQSFVTADRTDKVDSNVSQTAKTNVLDKAKPFSKISIAEHLAHALPVSTEGLPTGDHVRLLAGLASTYSVLGLDRKKAMVMKELVAQLTGALMQARKLGAAEMGIHPAASLSTDAGVGTLLAIAQESAGISELMVDLCHIYGASFLRSVRSVSPIYHDTKEFGSKRMSVDLLRALVAFCEASPDPRGTLLFTTTLLRFAGPNAAIDAAPESVANALPREEQMHLATVINRTVAVSRNLGLSDVQANYWDPFLVRGVEVMQSSGPRAVIDRAKLDGMGSSIAQLDPGNPLLYDPNASRPGTAVEPIFVLVQGEAAQCIVTLQNPFDIPVDVEGIEMVTDGLELPSEHDPVSLGPLRFQQVAVLLRPQHVGATKITGCRIRMQSCAPQVFPIVASAWSAKPELTIKGVGVQARTRKASPGEEKDLKSAGVNGAVVSVAVISSIPTLELEDSSHLETGLMLLEGESRSLTLRLRNTSAVDASIFDMVDTADVLTLVGARLSAESSIIVRPGDCRAFEFQVQGKAGTEATVANFYYAANSESMKYARLVSVPVVMTVNAALQVPLVEIVRPQGHRTDAVELLLDLRNAWPKFVSFKCAVKAVDMSAGEIVSQEGALAPGEVRRIHQVMPHDLASSQYENDAQQVCRQFLDRLQLEWHVDGRSGVVDVQSLTLSPESVELVRGHPIHVSVARPDAEAGIKVGSFVSIQAKLSNRASRGMPLSVQLVPRNPQLTDDDKNIAVAGSLQRLLPPLAPKARATVEFVVCPLLSGTTEMDLIVRPARLSRSETIDGWQSTQIVSLAVK